MNWTKFGESYGREYHAQGRKGSYVINLDQPPVDRWTLFLNSERIIDSIYFVRNAKTMAEEFDTLGRFDIAPDTQQRPDGCRPRVVHLSAAGATPLTVSPTSTFANTRSRVGVDAKVVAMSLLAEVNKHRIQIDRASVEWSPWKSGVYSILDTVFSARAKYGTMVKPMLNRLNTRPAMSDVASRTFSDFIMDVDACGADKFENYASRYLNRQQIGGRLKVQVVYDVAFFFKIRSIETMQDLRSQESKLETLVTVDLQSNISGIGPALSNYFLILLGDESKIKLDVMLLRFWQRLAGPPIDPSSPADYAFATCVFKIVAAQMATTPARLEKAIWSFESHNAK